MDELEGKPKCFGGYACERLNHMHLGKAFRGKPRRKPESGNPTFRDCRGARRKRGLASDDKVRASRLYPDHVRFCESAGVQLPRATHPGSWMMRPNIEETH